MTRLRWKRIRPNILVARDGKDRLRIETHKGYGIVDIERHDGSSSFSSHLEFYDLASLKRKAKRDQRIYWSIVKDTLVNDSLANDNDPSM